MLVNVVLKVTKHDGDEILQGEAQSAVRSAREMVREALKHMGEDDEFDFEVVHAKIEE